MRRTDRGFSALFVLIGIALIVAGVTAAISIGEEGSTGPVLAWTSVAVALPLLAYEAWRDLQSASVFTVIAALVGLIISLAILHFSAHTPVLLAWVALLCGSAMVAAIAGLVRTQHGRERITDLLAQRFGRGAIGEVEGVQLVVTGPGQPVAIGDRAEIQVHLQNCWSAKRTFAFSLRELGTGALRFPPIATVVIGPLEVGCLRIPVVPVRGPGNLTLVGSPRVKGWRGRRARQWHGRPVSGEVTGSMTAAAALGGMVVWGGGLRLTIPVASASTPIAGSATPPRVQFDVVWRPPAAEEPTRVQQGRIDPRRARGR
jgi:hypothetical protein